MKWSRPPVKSRKEIYEEEYNASKKGGEMFFPETLVRDAIVALLVVAAIVALAIILPARSEPAADPTSTTYNPRPEWYFLFFFEFLKLFPGYLEAVAAVVIPTIAILVLVLLPFFNRSPERRWSRRKAMIGAGVVVVIFLAVAGALSAPAKPAGEESRLVQAGRDVYNQVNCSYCHSTAGVGGAVGPDLTSIGAKLTNEQLTVYLKNPDAMVPNTLHPKLLFTEEELQALVAYLQTLGAPVIYTAQAPVLFEKNCSSCHRISGQGSTIGPDLSTVGDRRSINFLESFTSDPKTVFAGSTMPAFKDKLTQEQVHDIAAYLVNQKGAAQPQAHPAPPPGVTTPLRIPHNIEGRETCLVCHDTGVGRATVIPSDHTGRTNDMCLTCHKTAG